MTRGTEVQEHTTGEPCPSCEGDVLIALGGGDELHLQCDCGVVAALGPGTWPLADAA